MNLLSIYQQKIGANGFQADPRQQTALRKLQKISDRLLQTQRIKFFPFNKKPPVKGLYLWGEVGRGKTFVMDLFFDALPIEAKTRSHFNHFIKNTHQLLKENQGRKNPLNHVAKMIATVSKVICFDEFLVEDVADAMILGNLFKQLFGLGITLIATSNVAPYALYQGGLQRDLFLPTIDILAAHLEMFNLDQGIDYRKQNHISQDRYFFPTPAANQVLKRKFAKLSSEHAIYDTKMHLENRTVPVIAIDADYIWFDFSAICGIGRGVSDYIALTRKYQIIFISNIPVLTRQYEAETRRFIAMIDECYDQNKQLIISAAVHFSQLYQGTQLHLTFQRTISRLYELC